MKHTSKGLLEKTGVITANIQMVIITYAKRESVDALYVNFGEIKNDKGL
jgi:hypothetical protein